MENTQLVSVRECKDEIIDINKTLRTMCNHFGIPMDLEDQLMEDAMSTVDSNATGQHRYYSNKIGLVETVNNLKNVKNTHYGYRFSDKLIDSISKSAHKAIIQSIAELYGSLICRKAAMKLLIEKYSNYDDWSIKCSEATVEAHKTFRSIETNIGWNMNVNIKVANDKNPVGSVSSSESTRRTNDTDINVYLDGNWLTDIHEQGLSTVDIAGKLVMPLTVEKVEEHELTDEGIEIWKAKVIYTKVPRTVSTWQLSSNDWNKVVHIEEKYIAKQVLHASSFITTGNSLEWAIRTMKGRMKKEMFRMMDI